MKGSVRAANGVLRHLGCPSGAFRDRKVRQLRSRPDLGAHGGPTRAVDAAQHGFSLPCRGWTLGPASLRVSGRR
jgi:hypothetical protein